jgi:hypothetical protein
MGEMMRRRRTMLSLAILVVGAFSAVTATAASANYHVDSPKGASILGVQTSPSRLKMDVGSFQCAQVHTEGVMFEVAETLLVRPGWTYPSCTLQGSKAQVEWNSCGYQFGKTTAGEVFHSGMSIVCPYAPIVIKYPALGCEIKIPAQGPLNQVSFVNNPDGTVAGQYEVTGLSYSWNGGCPNAGGKSGSKTNGVFTGSFMLEAFNNGGTPDFWVD